ncbi:protein transport protein Tip20p [[Candida] jaroonii]|uniref:Protein transport protein Tip20p n=1 Tax=[Candida] jaroonii TaxID=467808 RepID=A0ACA9Y1J4_9ASCO|nr:protein transport protein Tip20p [[Candida] jaroonii]
MDYINSTIISLKDLGAIDDTIGDIQKDIDKTKDEVQLKLRKNSFEDGQTTKLVGEIMEKLSDLKEGDVDSCLEKLKSLEGYELTVVKQLMDLYHEKRQLLIDEKFLEQSEVVEQTLINLHSIDPKDFQNAFDDIQNLHCEFVSDGVVLEVKGQFERLFNEKLQAFRGEVENELKEFLKKKNWLSNSFKVETLDSNDLKFINSRVSQLVDLQSINNTPTYPDTWWAIDILLQPFFLRFDYHFNTKRNTNKISKPEWVFNFVEEFLSKNQKVFELSVNQSFKSTKKIMIYQVITSVFVPLRKKIINSVNVLNENIESFADDETNYDKTGRLLSHLIFELTSFDQRIRNNYKFNPYANDEVPTKKWMGLTSDILLHGDKERLGTSNWLIFENRLANNRFESEIINDENGLKIDMDFKNELEICKPTYSALNFVKLFDNLTSHYQTMKMVKFQLKYVSTIQLNLLDKYCKFLNGRLSKFDELYNSSRVLNLIPGSMDNTSKSESKVSESLKGLTMLTEIYCSTRFLIHSMDQWSEELIFIQLWNAYKSVATKKYNKDANIFDSTIDDYKKLSDNIKSRYESFFAKGLRDNLKEYINSSEWDLFQTKDNSLHFIPLTTNLPVYLNYIKSCISSLEYYEIVNGIVSSICDLWYEYIITNNKFNKLGSEQLQEDFEFILNRLKHELLIDHGDILSTANNHQLMKINQSIEILQRFDPVFSKNLLNSYNDETIRGEFSHHLNHLQNHEIKEILFRII